MHRHASKCCKVNHHYFLHKMQRSVLAIMLMLCMCSTAHSTTHRNIFPYYNPFCFNVAENDSYIVYSYKYRKQVFPGISLDYCMIKCMNKATNEVRIVFDTSREIKNIMLDNNVIYVMTNHSFYDELDLLCVPISGENESIIFRVPNHFNMSLGNFLGCSESSIYITTSDPDPNIRYITRYSVSEKKFYNVIQLNEDAQVYATEFNDVFWYFDGNNDYWVLFDVIHNKPILHKRLNEYQIVFADKDYMVAYGNNHQFGIIRVSDWLFLPLISPDNRNDNRFGIVHNNLIVASRYKSMTSIYSYPFQENAYPTLLGSFSNVYGVFMFNENILVQTTDESLTKQSAITSDTLYLFSCNVNDPEWKHDSIFEK